MQHTNVLIIIIESPNQAIASIDVATPSALRPTGAAERGSTAPVCWQLVRKSKRRFSASCTRYAEMLLHVPRPGALKPSCYPKHHQKLLVRCISQRAVSSSLHAVQRSKQQAAYYTYQMRVSHTQRLFRGMEKHATTFRCYGKAIASLLHLIHLHHHQPHQPSQSQDTRAAYAVLHAGGSKQRSTAEQCQAHVLYAMYSMYAAAAPTPPLITPPILLYMYTTPSQPPHTSASAPPTL
jgi:hypothetical protein